MSVKSFTRSFGGGEISPLLYGRLDLAKNQTGLALCKNFEVTPQGPIENRPGFEYVLKAKSVSAVLLPFVYNTDQSFALEFGPAYIRFHTLGGTLLETGKTITAITQAASGVFTSTAHGFVNGDWLFLSGIGGMTALNSRWGVVTGASTNAFSLLDLWGAPISTASLPAFTGGGTAARVYEIASPYAVQDLLDLHYVQSADVMTIAHANYQTRELRRLGATNWTLTTPAFSPGMPTPGVPAVLAAGPGGGTPSSLSYVTTAIASDTREESLQSPAASVSLDLSVAGNFALIQPSVVSNAVRYNVFKLQSGIYGYIGQSDGSAFKDDNITPDMSTTPPLSANPFAIGAIISVPVTAGGSNYGGGQISTVTLTAGGTGYTSPPTAVATGGDGAAGATFTVTINAGHVDTITIASPGGGYVLPTISFSGGGGTGATATATATPTGAVTLAITDGTGTGASLAPVVVGGVIQAVRVVTGGQGYTAPVVSVASAFGGSGATFGTPSLTAATVNPRAVSYFEQRRCFGGSLAAPQTVWATRSGTESNMTFSIPTQDDDAITARIVAREGQVVRHLVPFNELIALTSSGVWRLSPASGDPLTPATIAPKQHSPVGASMVQPIVTSASVLYAPARGAHVRELSYKWQSQRYEPDDVAVLAPHLFDFQTVVQLAYSTAPYQIAWAVRGDGILLGLTYQPEHEIKAWHQHDTQGLFKSACAIPEGDEDALYVIVRRSINFQNVEYVERRHTRRFTTLADSFFVDAGATYKGAPAKTITGLHHLEGVSVVALADGGVQPAQTVVGGSITLQAAASVVQVGLAYTAQAQTLPFASEQMAAFGQGVVKNVNEVWLDVYQCGAGIQAGAGFDRMREFPQRTVNDNYGAPPALRTGMDALKIDGRWSDSGSVCIQQANPLPVTLRSMTVEVATGG